jgi:hypothetical protein
MMKIAKTLGLALLSISATHAICEEVVYLDFSDRPNQTVRVIDSSTTHVEVDVKGDTDLIREKMQGGRTFPFRLTQYKTQKISTRTGVLERDGSFAFERTIEDVLSFVEDEHGTRIAVPDRMNDMVGMVIRGVMYSDGGMEVNGIDGGNVTPENEALIRTIFESGPVVEAAPEHALRLGDVFSTEMPFEMPVPGYNSITVNAKSVYVLKRIEGDIAIFDMDMTFDVSSPPDGVHVTANGEGAGSMKYNIKTQLRERMDMEMAMDMRFQADGLVISSKLNSHSTTQQYLLEPANEGPTEASDPIWPALRSGPTG